MPGLLVGSRFSTRALTSVGIRYCIRNPSFDDIILDTDQFIAEFVDVLKLISPIGASRKRGRCLTTALHRLFHAHYAELIHSGATEDEWILRCFMETRSCDPRTWHIVNTGNRFNEKRNIPFSAISLSYRKDDTVMFREIKIYYPEKDHQPKRQSSRRS